LAAFVPGVDVVVVDAVGAEVTVVASDAGPVGLGGVAAATGPDVLARTAPITATASTTERFRCAL
jgi:hypothetical protein